MDRIFELVFTFSPSKTNALMHSIPFIFNQTSLSLFMISQVTSTLRAEPTPTCHAAQPSSQSGPQPNPLALAPNRSSSSTTPSTLPYRPRFAAGLIFR